MELKLPNVLCDTQKNTSFNRTFMELKCEFVDLILQSLNVLIVPLWN